MNGSRSWASMRTTQDVYLSFGFKEGTDITLTSKESENLNDIISDIISENVSGNSLDIYDSKMCDGFTGDEHITDEYEYEFDFEAHIRVFGSYYYDPGCKYMSNGDPGYPPESDWDPKEGWIEEINKKAVIDQLSKLDKIGSLIDKSTIYISINDYNEDGEIEES